MDTKTIGFHPPSELGTTKKFVHPHIVGDAALQLRTDISKPYPDRNLDLPTIVHNYRLSRARRTSENCFGILAQRFRVFLTTIDLHPQFVEDLVMAACCLHNYLIENQSSFYVNQGDMDYEDGDHMLVLGSWRDSTAKQLMSLEKSKTHIGTLSARQQRDTMKEYFMSTVFSGGITWSMRTVQIIEIGINSILHSPCNWTWLLCLCPCKEAGTPNDFWPTPVF